MMKELGHEHFITEQKEYEQLQEIPTRQAIVDEYMRNDAERTINITSSST